MAFVFPPPLPSFSPSSPFWLLTSANGIGAPSAGRLERRRSPRLAPPESPTLPDTLGVACAHLAQHPRDVVHPRQAWALGL